MKASVAIPAPKKKAMTCSRTSPSTREKAVAPETVPTDLTKGLSWTELVDKPQTPIYIPKLIRRMIKKGIAVAKP
jgi:hypothetical protein